MDNGNFTEKKRPVSPVNGQPIPNGRPKGVPNKSTQAVRQAIAIFVEKNSENLDKWAREIYEQKGAEGAMKVFMDLLEYAQPKLARVEMQALDAEGNKSDSFKIEIEHVKPIDAKN